MKYSIFFIKLVAVTVFGLAATIFACWANSPTIGAVCTGITLCCFYAVLNLASGDKYSKKYLQQKEKEL